MTLTEGDITELVHTIVSTALGLDVEGRAPEPTGDGGRPMIEAAVRIDGVWSGVVVLQVSEALAARCTQRMLDLGAAPPTPEDVRDAVGELINMAGGNIKGLLTEAGARLSLPVVARGDDDVVRLGEGRLVQRLEYACGGEPLVLTVLEHPSARPAS